MFDYTKLKNRIIEKCSCNVNFAIKMRISEKTLCSKLDNRGDFKQKEIMRACQLLDIPIDEITSYFFTVNVQYYGQNAN